MRFNLSVLLFVLLNALSNSHAAPSATSDWPEWTAFSERFVQNGRVIDITFEGKTTSEGQSYGLFFALVANQRAQFDTILKWTSDNLAAGQLGSKLPAWLWGQRADGSWGVKDQNSASDGDLWIAYSLLEAARVWNAPDYAVMGRKLLTQIAKHEVAQAGAAGSVLLPGAIGFALDKGRFRINPSYLPEFMFRYLAAIDPQGPWQTVWDSYARMAPKVFSAGVAPDLFVVDSKGAVTPDSEREPSGSYDAIRVYLWAGMSGQMSGRMSGEAPSQDSKSMLRMLAGYAALIDKYGAPPEKVSPLTGKATKTDYSPIGFSGASLPFLSALNNRSALDMQRDRIRATTLRSLGTTTHYYDQVLLLFGKGWLDGHYRFDAQGRLQLKWMR